MVKSFNGFPLGLVIVLTSKFRKMLKGNKPELVVGTLTVLAGVLLLILTNTWSPYHVDSTGYVLRALDFYSGKSIGTWRYGTVILMIPFVPLSWIFGINAVHVAFVVISFLSLVLYFLYFRRTSLSFAVFSMLVLFSSPAFVMTLNIGKEDVLGIGIFLGSLLLYERWPLASGFLAGYEIAYKELVALLLPLFLLVLIKDFTGRRWKRLVLFFLGGVLSLPVALPELTRIVTQKSPTMGVFYGFNSLMLPIGSRLLLEGIGLSLIVLIPSLMFLFSKSQKKSQKIVVTGILLYAYLVFLFLANVSTVQYRTAIVLLPMLLFAAALSWNYVDEKVRRAVLVLAIAVAAFNLWNLFPSMVVHKANLPALYAKTLGDLDVKYVLTMDFCSLYRYYGGKECITHKPFPSSIDIENVFKRIKSLKDGGIALSPDFFAYADKDFATRFFTEFNIDVISYQWYEDYHRVRIYPRELPGCTFMADGKENMNGMEVTRGTVSCSNGEKGIMYKYMDVYLIGIRRSPVAVVK